MVDREQEERKKKERKESKVLAGLLIYNAPLSYLTLDSHLVAKIEGDEITGRSFCLLCTYRIFFRCATNIPENISLFPGAVLLSLLLARQPRQARLTGDRLIGGDIV